MSNEEENELDGAATLMWLSAEAGYPLAVQEAGERWRAMSRHERATAMHTAKVIRGEVTGPLNGPEPPPRLKPADLEALPPAARQVALAAVAEPGPRHRFFEEKVGPLLAQVKDLCVEAGINFVGVFELDVVEVSDTTKVASMVVTGRIDDDASAQMRRVGRAVASMAGDQSPEQLRPEQLLVELLKRLGPTDDDGEDSPA